MGHNPNGDTPYPALPRLVDAVISAASSLEEERLDTACLALIAYLRCRHASPEAQVAARVLRELRKWRHFGAMQRVADALIRLGCHAHLVYLQYAQALIDRGELIPALELLLNLVERAKSDADEYSETCGLLGRVYKQIYTEAQGSRLGMAEAALGEAIAYYRKVYDADPTKVWHGVNIVALLRRAMRDGVVAPDASNPNLIAEAIRSHVDQRWTEELPAWDYAAAAEACLALDDWTGAERWLQKYLTAKDVDAFAIAGTLRQFTEIWGLRVDGSPSGELIPVLRAALLSHEHGRLDLTPAQVNRMHGVKEDAFERILGDTGLQTYQWMCQAIERARAIAKIRQSDGRGVGTGFLLRGSELYAPLGDELLLLTNAHVLSDDTAHRAAVKSDDAQITFEALAEPGRTPIRHRVAKLVWNSAPAALDATLLRLGPPPKDVEPCPISTNLPAPGENQRLYVIGHPLGGELSFSLQDNRLLDHEGPPNGKPSQIGRCLLHYRAPTEPGSSGSPVFVQSGWKVVGLHHAGSEFMPRLNRKLGTYAANEGVWIRSIKDCLISELGGLPTHAKIN
jgi:tetratricopeptide (TPR) repeat protein